MTLRRTESLSVDTSDQHSPPPARSIITPPFTLQSRKGVLYCQDEVWEKPENPRLIEPIPRSSERWKQLYKQRWGVERIFKSAKESLRLERHCVMGIPKVSLNAALTFLTFQMTVMFNLLFGQPLRWMISPVG